MRLQCRLMLGRVLHQPLKTFFYSTKCLVSLVVLPNSHDFCTRTCTRTLCPYSMSVSRHTRTHTRTQNLYVKTKF